MLIANAMSSPSGSKNQIEMEGDFGKRHPVNGLRNQPLHKRGLLE
jgi:hypothetical protein